MAQRATYMNRLGQLSQLAFHFEPSMAPTRRYMKWAAANAGTGKTCPFAHEVHA